MGPQRGKFNPFLAVAIFFAITGLVFYIMARPGGHEKAGIQANLLSPGKVAIVKLHGVIVDGKEVKEQLRDWAEDDSVKAIVLHIVSPGGMVAPSQEIHSAVKRAVKEKPVVASMGAVAASGGYYVAAPCSKIVANPGTITGSIGVIMMFSTTYDLMSKIGLGAVVVKSGKFKDTGSPHRPFTEEDRELMQGVVDDTYDQFLQAVADGRKMPVEKARQVADGRVMSGRQAFKTKLVDQLGDMEDAVELAARLGGIEGEPETVEKTTSKGLMGVLFGEEEGDEVSLPFRFLLPTGIYYLWPAAW